MWVVLATPALSVPQAWRNSAGQWISQHFPSRSLKDEQLDATGCEVWIHKILARLDTSPVMCRRLRRTDRCADEGGLFKEGFLLQALIFVLQFDDTCCTQQSVARLKGWPSRVASTHRAHCGHCRPLNNTAEHSCVLTLQAQKNVGRRTGQGWDGGCVGEENSYCRKGGAQQADGEHKLLECLWSRHWTSGGCPFVRRRLLKQKSQGAC